MTLKKDRTAEPGDFKLSSKGEKGRAIMMREGRSLCIKVSTTAGVL